MKNRIENSSWLEGEEQSPRLFKTEGKLHFDQAMMEGDRLASLSFNMSDYERLVYTEQIATQGCNYLTMGLIVRGNDLDEINYKVAFYNENLTCLDIYVQNVAPEIETHFKRICVTYPIPTDTAFIRVGWEFKGLITGMSCFHPFVYLQ